MTDTIGWDEMLTQLRNVSHDDLDDAYAGQFCDDCPTALKYDRRFPRDSRPLFCPDCSPDIAEAQP